MKVKDLYALVMSMHLVDDDLKPSPSSEFVLCCSYNKDKMDHYCSVLQEASDIKFKLRPSNTVVEEYRVKVVSLL